MKMFFNFKCGASGDKFERLVESSVKEIKCKCGAKALRQLSTPKFLNNSCGNNASWR